jgi:alkanesulfonate monooxygenase SsuD/methylene tetrahydromethanopterin reductase-like flavin-dependent oxidoreductase (luciferase family)
MDKAKAQANVLAQKTQEAAKDAAREGKARLDQAQAARQADTMLRNLGALVYAERTGRAAADSPDQIARAVSTISAHEAKYGISLKIQPTPQGGEQPPGPGGVPPQGGPAGDGYPPPQGGSYPPESGPVP